jgi:TonB family protein
VSNLIGAPGPVDPEPGQAGGVFQEGDLTDSPRIVHFPDPRYPPALREIGMEGAVQLAYVVDTLGVVEPGSVTVVSSDHPLMTDAVRLALAGARYLPGRNRGQPVRTKVRQTVRFSLMSL